MTIEPYNYNDEPSGRADTLAMALDKCERLEKQLSVAKEALEEIEKNGTDSAIQTITTLCVNNWLWAHKALKEIKELEK